MKTDRSSFEIFKSNVCHQVKEQGELEFIKKTILSNEVQKLYEKNGILKVSISLLWLTTCVERTQFLSTVDIIS